MSEAVYAVVLVTASSEAEGLKLKKVLMEARKAACVNIISQVESHFWWKGKVDIADEVLLIIKTKVSSVNDIIKLVKEAHSYVIPEIIALPVIAGNDDYLKWVDEEVKG
jgi:periplasmic divalent cation tolerance protein